MREVAEKLLAIVTHTQSRLQHLSDDVTSRPSSTGGWSHKQVIGHLIDSASNNHQRFVRLALTNDHAFPGYEQDAWVTLQGYGNRPWADLLQLWSAFNSHMAHLIATAPESALGHKATIAGGGEVTLEFLMRDYVDHLQHHVRTLK